MKTSIIVLHRYPYGDSSWVVKTLSPDVGVLSLLVKGAKSKNSPFKTAIDPLVHSELELRYKSGNSLLFPKEVCLRDYYPKMRTRLQDLATAQFFAEVLLRLGTNESYAAEEFLWFRGVLETLELNGANEKSMSVWLQKLCEILGYAPVILTCGLCGRDLTDAPADIWFSHGGAVCHNCLDNKKTSYSKDFLSELHQFACGKSELPATAYSRIENFFLRHLRTHTGALENLRSWEWLQETRGL
ncbi:hypothetical protein AGMMS49938_00570 [Fibrobacterales bacterium]|nr:hypothetical protein AGMMS49938_00570 [Fibrobacterales bacterium]